MNFLSVEDASRESVPDSPTLRRYMSYDWEDESTEDKRESSVTLDAPNTSLASRNSLISPRAVSRTIPNYKSPRDGDEHSTKRLSQSLVTDFPNLIREQSSTTFLDEPSIEEIHRNSLELHRNSSERDNEPTKTIFENGTGMNSPKLDDSKGDSNRTAKE